MTVSQVYDKLKEYIDLKLSFLQTELTSLFTTYKTQEVGNNINDIKIIGDNINNIKIVEDNINDIVTTSTNINDLISLNSILSGLSYITQDGKLYIEGSNFIQDISFNADQELIISY